MHRYISILPSALGDGKYKTAMDIISYVNVSLQDVVQAIREVGEQRQDILLSSFSVPGFVQLTVEATCKYSHYLSSQVRRLRCICASV